MKISTFDSTKFCLTNHLNQSFGIGFDKKGNIEIRSYEKGQRMVKIDYKGCVVE